MQNDSLFHLLMLGVGLYFAKLWIDDYRCARAGKPSPRPLPGATPAPRTALIIAAAGGFAIVAAETYGEIALGIAGEQSKITVLFAAYTLVAAVVEEIIFRGYVVIADRGKALRWGSILIASVMFSALHPFLWKWEGGLPWSGGRLEWTFTVKGWFSTGAVFVASLWFYCVRFARFNPNHSLLPCFAAHGAKNMGVIVIKAAQGYLVGWW